MTRHERFPLETGDVHVRVGTPEDVHAVMDVALMACDENALCRPNTDKLLQDIWAALNLQHGICGIVGDPGSIVEGVVVLRVGSLWYSDTKTLEERAVFIRPEYRSAKGGRATKLCRFAMQAADTLGMPLSIGVLSDSRTKSKVKMYSRLLGEPTGAYWIYGTRTGQVSSVVGENEEDRIGYDNSLSYKSEL